ncbi:MAG: hypothetical protein AB7K52_08000 [Phycisphaerales bacterium]
MERAIITSVYDHGRSLGEIAAIAGIAPRTLGRRVRAITRRLLDPAFPFVLGRRHEWTPTVRAIATETIIRGRSVRAVARELGLTYHVVRRHCDTIRGMVNAHPPKGLSAAAARRAPASSAADSRAATIRRDAPRDWREEVA